MTIKNIENIYEQLDEIKARLGALETPKEETKRRGRKKKE